MDEWDRRIAEIVASKSPDQQRVWADYKQREGATLYRQLIWVRQLASAAYHIEQQGTRANWQTFELFWIRLYGVLDELCGGYAKHVALIGPEQPNEGLEVRWIRLQHECASSILKPLTEQEIIVIDWLRQRSAHIFQDCYRRTFDPSRAKVKERRGIKLLGNKTFTIDETDAARESLLQQHGDDEVAMQVALAGKMLTAIGTFALVHETSLGQ